MDSIACIRANSNGFILATIVSVHRVAVCSTSHTQWKMFCSGRCFCLRTLSKSWSKTAGSHCLGTWHGNIKGMNCKGQTDLPNLNVEPVAAVEGRNKPAPADVSGELTGRMPETVVVRPYSGLLQPILNGEPVAVLLAGRGLPIRARGCVLVG